MTRRLTQDRDADRSDAAATGRSRNALVAALLGLALTAVTCLVAAAAERQSLIHHYADVVLFNGQVLTVDRDFTVAEALAVRDGRILALGDSDEILSLAGPDTERFDLEGRTVTPGYIYNDADNAVPGGDAYKETQVAGHMSGRIAGATLAELLSSIDEVLAKGEQGEPVFINMPKASPREAEQWTATDLDELAPGNPVALFFNDSVVIVNHAMLQRAFDAGLPPNHFGVVKDEDGNPTGQLFQQAAGFIGWDTRPWPSRAFIDISLQQTQASLLGLLSVGVTTATGHMGGLTVSMLNELFQQEKLNMRVYPGHDMFRQNVFAEQYLKRIGNLVNFSLAHPKRGPLVKIVGAATGPVDDGSNSQYGILSIDPKETIDFEIGGTPHGINKWTGQVWTGLTWDDMTAEQKANVDYNTVAAMLRHGWNMSGNHNMGAEALRINLLAIDQYHASDSERYFAPQKPNAFDHNLIWHESNYSLLDKYKDSVTLGLKLEIFNQRKSVTGRRLLEAQYGERMHTMQPVAELLERGYQVHIEGTDSSTHPMWAIERLVTRTDDDGNVWGANQAIDRKTALRMLTHSAARFIGEEANLGSLEPGKWADLVVLNGDFLAVPDDEIDSLDIDRTYVGGDLVYDVALWD